MKDLEALWFVGAAVAVLWLAPTMLARKLTIDRGRGPGVGIGLGLVLGWIGVLVAAILNPIEDPSSRFQCPYCAESIKQDAKVCRYCQRDVAAST